MQKSTKIFLGAATLWPVIYMFIFMLFVVSSVFFAPSDGNAFPAAFLVIFALHLLTMLLGLALTVFYIVDVFRNERVEKDKKPLWAVVIFLGSMIAMPIYWYLFIWKEPSPGEYFSRGQLNRVDTSAWTNSSSESRQREEQYVPPRQPPDWR